MSKSPVNFGVTLFYGHAIINLRVSLNSNEFDKMKEAYPMLHWSRNIKHLAVIEGVLPIQIYDTNFYWDLKQARLRTKMHILIDDINNIDRIKRDILHQHESMTAISDL